MSRSLDGRVAVVTGGGKGLGRAFALHLADLGASVVVNNRNREVDADGRGPADHVAAEIVERGGRAVAHHGDVTNPTIGDDLVRAALESFGRYDVCVTSAGVSNPQLVHRTTPENLRTVLDINVNGTVLVAAAALAHMREAGHGRIVLIASGAGLHGEATASAYAASKGAVIAFGRTAAAEGEGKGVLTNVVLPYATTQMTARGMDPRHADRMRSDLVAPVVGALADPGSSINGQVVVAAGAGLRATDAVEWDTVLLPEGAIGGADLDVLLRRSREGSLHTYPKALDAFQDLAADLNTL